MLDIAEKTLNAVVSKSPRQPRTWGGTFGVWILLEILLIFVIFALQGAWPIPDVNEACYVGKSIRFWDAAWAQGDFFLESANPHAAYYVTLGWLSLFLTPIVFTWTVRILGWLLLAISWQRLSSAIIPRAGVSVLTAAIFAYLAESCTLAGEWVIGGTESKVLAYAAAFGAIAAMLRGRWNVCWLLIGVGTLFHVLVGGWTGVILAAVWLCGKITEHSVEYPASARFPALRAMLPGLIVGVLIALPGLWLSLRLNVGVDAATATAADYISVYRRLPFHLYLHGMDANRILRFFWQVLAFGLIGLLLVGRQTRCMSGQLCVLLGGVGLFGTLGVICARGIDGTKAGDAAMLTSLILIAIAMFIFLGGWTLYRPHQGIKHQRLCMSASMGRASSSEYPEAEGLADQVVLGSLLLALSGGFWSWYALYFEQYELAARILKFYWFRLADIFVPMGLTFRAVQWALATCGMLPSNPSRISVCQHFGRSGRSGDLCPLTRIEKVTVCDRIGKVPASCPTLTVSCVESGADANDPLWWLGRGLGALVGRCGGYLLCAGLILFAVVYVGEIGRMRVQTWSDPPRAEAKMQPVEWIAACDWIRNSGVIPSGARFLTPRENSTFTWRTGHPQVVTRKDFPQDARSIVEWYSRLQEIYSPHPEFPWPNWFSSLSERKPDDLRRIAEKYEAPYLIVETKQKLPFESLYINGRYAIYRLY